MTKKHIIIAINARGALTIDALKVDKIIIENQAHRILLRRAREDGTNIAEALRRTLTEAINDYIDRNTIL
jgi:hypothetical protein